MTHRDELFQIAEQYCISQNWHYDTLPDKYAIKFGMNLKCKLKSAQVWIEAKDTTIVVYAICPISADPEDIPKVVEFITRANYGLMIGNFELDYRDGEVRYKTSLSSKSRLPSMDDVERIVDLSYMMMERYGNGLCKLIMGFGEPEELVKECES